MEGYDENSQGQGGSGGHKFGGVGFLDKAVVIMMDVSYLVGILFTCP